MRTGFGLPTQPSPNSAGWLLGCDLGWASDPPMDDRKSKFDDCWISMDDRFGLDREQNSMKTRF